MRERASHDRFRDFNVMKRELESGQWVIEHIPMTGGDPDQGPKDPVLSNGYPSSPQGDASGATGAPVLPVHSSPDHESVTYGRDRAPLPCPVAVESLSLSLETPLRHSCLYPPDSSQGGDPQTGLGSVDSVMGSRTLIEECGGEGMGDESLAEESSEEGADDGECDSEGPDADCDSQCSSGCSQDDSGSDTGSETDAATGKADTPGVEVEGGAGGSSARPPALPPIHSLLLTQPHLNSELHMSLVPTYAIAATKYSHLYNLTPLPPDAASAPLCQAAAIVHNRAAYAHGTRIPRNLLGLPAHTLPFSAVKALFGTGQVSDPVDLGCLPFLLPSHDFPPGPAPSLPNRRAPSLAWVLTTKAPRERTRIKHRRDYGETRESRAPKVLSLSASVSVSRSRSRGDRVSVERDRSLDRGKRSRVRERGGERSQYHRRPCGGLTHPDAIRLAAKRQRERQAVVVPFYAGPRGRQGARTQAGRERDSAYAKGTAVGNTFTHRPPLSVGAGSLSVEQSVSSRPVPVSFFDTQAGW
ncbi:hypothetical protein KIPB_002407 [Kipferlia bialata]|uniref:Uncharacterized protein n=1 Tax=Kipferlia bialata TaxID=797122 RepID=A0A9K3GG42_9EUKA|nr:hypothetical protein KIPB_002407 [Kipferlia bialata]|eukprot:g2407.t1